MSTPGTFTDMHGNSYRIQASETSQNHVYLTMLDNHPSRWISAEDAPAVALAILTESGVKARKYTPGSDVTAQVAREAAAGWAQVAIDLAEQECAERAEREAEDAKVQEWLDARNAEFGATDHWELDDAARAGYRASKAFWEKHLAARDEDGEKEPEPRVLQHGDPEPEVGTRWEDTEGSVWWFTGTGWTCSPVSNGARWPGGRECTERWFPMIEVTE